jgi:arginine decarboxylase
MPEGAKPTKPVATLLDLRATLNRKNRREHFHDAVQIKDDAQARFDLGLLDLSTKAQVETLFWEIAERVVALYVNSKTTPEEIHDLKDSLGDQFLCNFSVFQSLLDHWALGQLFPIAPIHRQNQQVHRQWRRGQSHAAVAFAQRQALLPRHLPARRVPGHHG